ncbi:hypothetical protein L1987_37798 [Smallanthus sonchifolius]|uniref:Uncharacterized protein n=1 Tax=Smallanthus sonchifolius TaxID=185202 RepID=A0ACB9HHD7_9ASTR|nr:hypothetical protein L1987_37798 [Smallanthus sonchifolius]
MHPQEIRPRTRMQHLMLHQLAVAFDILSSLLIYIISGRGNGRGGHAGRRGGRAGGRGGLRNINMTAAELTALINERVAEAVATSQAAANAGGKHNHQQVCTFKAYMDCKPHSFSGAEGAVGLLCWMEKSESAFAMCNCPPNNQVKYASSTLEGPTLTWWNSQVQMLTLEMANALPWDEFKTMQREEYCPRDEVQKLEGEFWNLKMEGSEIESYTTRSHELANLCPQMSMVTSSIPTTIQQAIWLAHRLTDQEVAQGTLTPRGTLSKTTDNKRKFDSSFPKTFHSNPPSQQQQQQHRKLEHSKNNNQSNSSRQNQGSYIGKYPKCNNCNFHHHGACDRYHCHRCGKMEGHFKKNCPQLRRNENENGNGNNHQGGNGNCNNHHGGNGNNNGNGAKGRAFMIGSGEARNDQNVVNGMFLLNDHFASVLFDTGTDRSFISRELSSRLGINPTSLEHHYTVEIADGKVIEATHILKGCKLELSGHKLNIDLMQVTLGSFDRIVGMDWLSKNQDEIICSEKIVRIPLPCGETLSVHGERSGAVMGIISFKKAQKCLRKGHTAILDLVADKSTEEKKLEDIPIIHEFLEVFPEDLPSLPPHRQVKFQIDLTPGAAPIARAPYRLAPSELQELSTQLQELLDKGFIRPISSPWGAPVLFLKKKDGTFRMCID